MIFISHNSKDKPIIEPIAVRLAHVFGQDNVFYDSWSIQPGDGIIDKMNEGLSQCRYFFYFVSVNSLTSSMVKMEWQNALVKAAQNMIKFIPVRLDQSSLPPIMLQTLYIDLFSNGVDVAVRQMIDVITGKNTFQQSSLKFNNLVAYKYHEGNKLIVECRALQYLEPITMFSFMTFDDIDKISENVPSEAMHTSGKHKNIQLDNGIVANFITLGLGRGTLPGFPFKVEFFSKSLPKFDIVAVLHQVSIENFAMIPLICVRP
mgnify:CR=1 FL=1